MSDTVTPPRTKVRQKTERPRLHKVILVNDDFTPREFVVEVLKAVFGMGRDQAYRIMITAHSRGVCVVAVYAKDIAETKATMEKMRTFCDEIEDLLMGNEIFAARCRGVGVIPPDVGLAYGLSGANIRGSGVDWDLRRDGDADLVYDQIDWQVWTHPDGDSFARFDVRIDEMEQSCRIIEQALAELPDGPIMPKKVPKKIKPKPGDSYFAVESARGQFGMYLVSDGTEIPAKIMRSRSWGMPTFDSV